MNIETLKDEGFLRIKYPPDLYRAVRASLTSWQAFCGLSMETKDSFSNHDRNVDFGYMFRNESGATADSKEMFHVSKRDLPELIERSRGVSHEDALTFFMEVQTLIEHLTPVIADSAQRIEKRYNMPGFAEKMMAKADNWTFRYLHYFGGEVLANAHCDRGACTIHLCETAPGGEYLDFEGNWKSWPVSEEETILFPAMELQHASNCELKALWHRVTANEETKTNGRFAIVAFVDIGHTFRYDSDTNGRLQDFTEGFNYTMPCDEFKSLFKERI